MGELWPNLSRRGLLGGMASGVVASALPVGAASAREPDPGDETRPHMQTGLDNRMRSDRAWERFLAEQDLVWRRLPRTLGDGDFDGTGATYPATRIPQTGTITDDGIEFLIVNGVEGTRNNVTAAGQTIPVPTGRYARLHLLGASDNGNTDATLTASYVDGSTATLPLRLTDWKSGPSFGETEAIRTTQFHTRAGARDVKVAIFHQVVELDPARELRSITLPALTRPRPHLFAISLERPT